MRTSTDIRAIAVSTLTMLLWWGGANLRAENLARLNGVVVVADSRSRDRWGLDGYHPTYVNDGNTDGSGHGARTTSWASDNWEVVHTLAIIFPHRVSVEEVAVHWPPLRGTALTPKRFSIEGYRNGRWAGLAVVETDKPTPVSKVRIAAAVVDALRIVQPPDGVAPSADRRLCIAEVEVIGGPDDPPTAVNMAEMKRELESELQALRATENAARVAPALDVVMKTPKRRGFMAIINRQDVARGRDNVSARPWAKTLARKIEQDADWWLQQSDDRIYDLVPAGNPRAICPQFEKGCPIHGGARQSFTATIEAPYRWHCRHGGEVWYDGAVIKNPETGADVTVSDDGNGWLAPEGFLHPGRRYYFVAAYRYFLIGKLFSSPYEPDGGSAYRGGTPVVQLALAYAITGDARYAHKCAVMLNRLAELYRTYDGCIEGPSQRQDGYIGQTFERFLVQNLILACDLIWDEIDGDEELIRFFADKGDADYDGDGKITGADFTYNLQRNLLGYVYEYLHRLMPYMDGDFLMYELTALAALAHCLGSADIAQEALEGDLGLRALLNNSWFRDGKYIYDSCSYNVGNARTPLAIAEWLHGLQVPPRYPDPVDVYHHPDYRMAMLFDFLRRIDCDGRVPQIGDGGGSRNGNLRLTPPYDIYDERALVRLPEKRDFYLSRLGAAANHDLESYRSGRADWWLLFHAGHEGTTTTPTDKPPSATPATSQLFEDGGIAILRAGANPASRQHLCLTFSKGGYGHGHTDKLAINVFRYGFDLTADLGYPTTWTDLKAGGWETDTASHCTVMLDETEQRSNVIGHLHAFATLPKMDLVDASAGGAYPKSSLYRRTVALVRADDGEPLYTVDVFRLAGAKTRDYLFHSLGKPQDMVVELAEGKATWTKQPTGSLAGQDVAPMTRGGYGFLSDVQRARTDGPVTATWRMAAGSSQTDRYLLTRRQLKNFTADFTVVRTGKASGKRERALFAFCVDPSNVGNRRVAWIDAGGELPVGKPVRVHIDVTAGQAQVSFDGVPSKHGVDTAGTPQEGGGVGFLHYYNYAYEYRDLVLTPEGGKPIHVDPSAGLDRRFWERIDHTYEVADGTLHARDYETLALRLHLLGRPGREVIRAKAEGSGVRGKSPYEGHLILRDRTQDESLATAFVAVIEAEREDPPVKSVTPMNVTSPEPTPNDAGNVVAFRVTTSRPQAGDRTDYVLSSLDPTASVVAELDGVRVGLKGRFGFVTTHRGRVTSLSLVGGGSLTCGQKRLDLPPDFHGQVVKAEPGTSALLIRADSDGPSPSPDLVGRHLLITRPTYACPSVYKITNIEPVDGAVWRFRLNMPLAVARGFIKNVDAEVGAFSTRTPVMKLRVNPGLFNGKPVRNAPDAPEHRLKNATEAAFTLSDPGSGLSDFAVGGEYIIYDVGTGDHATVISLGSACYEGDGAQ